MIDEIKNGIEKGKQYSEKLVVKKCIGRFALYPAQEQ